MSSDNENSDWKTPSLIIPPNSITVPVVVLNRSNDTPRKENTFHSPSPSKIHNSKLVRESFDALFRSTPIPPMLEGSIKLKDTSQLSSLLESTAKINKNTELSLPPNTFSTPNHSSAPNNINSSPSKSISYPHHNYPLPPNLHSPPSLIPAYYPIHLHSPFIYQHPYHPYPFPPFPSPATPPVYHSPFAQPKLPTSTSIISSSGSSSNSAKQSSPMKSSKDSNTEMLTPLKLNYDDLDEEKKESENDVPIETIEEDNTSSVPIIKPRRSLSGRKDSLLLLVTSPDMPESSPVVEKSKVQATSTKILTPNTRKRNQEKLLEKEKEIHAEDDERKKRLRLKGKNESSSLLSLRDNINSSNATTNSEEKIDRVESLAQRKNKATSISKTSKSLHSLASSLISNDKQKEQIPVVKTEFKSQDWLPHEKVAIYHLHSLTDVTRDDFWEHISEKLSNQGIIKTWQECQSYWYSVVHEKKQQQLEKEKEKEKKKIESTISKFEKIANKKEKKTANKRGPKGKIPEKETDDEETEKSMRWRKNDTKILAEAVSQASKVDDVFDDAYFTYNATTPIKAIRKSKSSSLSLLQSPPMVTLRSPGGRRLVTGNDDNDAPPNFSSSIEKEGNFYLTKNVQKVEKKRLPPVIVSTTATKNGTKSKKGNSKQAPVPVAAPAPVSTPKSNTSYKSSAIVDTLDFIPKDPLSIKKKVDQAIREMRLRNFEREDDGESIGSQDEYDEESEED